MEIFMNVEGNDSGFVCIKVPIECRPDGISQAEFEILEADSILEACTSHLARITGSPKACRALAKCFFPDDTGVSPEDREAFHQDYHDQILQALIDGNWEKFKLSMYKTALLMTGNALLLESSGGERRCDCQCSIGVGKKDFTEAKEDWKENYLGRTLMVIRHAYTEEERTGALKKPPLTDVLTV